MIFTVHCTYQPYKIFLNKELNKCCHIKYVLLYSYDVFGPITKAICTELHKNKINILHDLNHNLKKNMYISIYIVNMSENHITTSIFPDGTEAGYQLILHVYIKLLFASNQNCYPINIQVQRDFIRNSKNALFNETQENDMRILMYQEVAEKLIRYINL